MKKIGVQPNQLEQQAPTQFEEIRLKPVLPDTTSIDITKLHSLEQKFKSVKQSHKSSDFIEKINAVLNLFDGDEVHYSWEVILFVMTECERFLLVKGSGAEKQAIVIEICKKYFNDDEVLVKLVISLLMHRLPQIKFLERIIRRAYRWIFKKVQTK
jgi:hypothetical protein